MLAIYCLVELREHVSLTEHGVMGTLLVKVAIAMLCMYKIQKHFQNVMLVGMASEINKNYTYKCVDRPRHNGIKGAKAKCAH